MAWCRARSAEPDVELAAAERVRDRHRGPGRHVGAAGRLAAAGGAARLEQLGEDPNKGVVFHCSNLPKAFFTEQRMDYQEIIAGTVGRRTPTARSSDASRRGRSRITASRPTICRADSAYCGEGRFTGDTLQTFGGYGVTEIPEFQKLLKFVCQRGFEASRRGNAGDRASAIHDALATLPALGRVSPRVAAELIVPEEELTGPQQAKIAVIASTVNDHGERGAW